MTTRKTRDLRATPMRPGLSVESAFPESYTVQRRKTPLVLHISGMEPEEAFEVAITFIGRRLGTITINARPD